jgi:hypothetical protein
MEASRKKPLVATKDERKEKHWVRRMETDWKEKL